MTGICLVWLSVTRSGIAAYRRFGNGINGLSIPSLLEHFHSSSLFSLLARPRHSLRSHTIRLLLPSLSHLHINRSRGQTSPRMKESEFSDHFLSRLRPNSSMRLGDESGFLDIAVDCFSTRPYFFFFHSAITLLWHSCDPYSLGLGQGSSSFASYCVLFLYFHFP